MASPSTKTIKAHLAQAKKIIKCAQDLEKEAIAAWGSPAEAISEFLDQETYTRLKALPISELKELAGLKARWNTLEAGGFRTVADVDYSSVFELTSVDGIGEKTAFKLRNAAQSVSRQIRESVRIQLDPNHRTAHATAVIRALYRKTSAEKAWSEFEKHFRPNLTYLENMSERVKPAARTWAKFLPFGKARREGLESVDPFLNWFKTTLHQDLITALDKALAQVRLDPIENELWLDFESNAARYYSQLEQFHEASKPSAEAIQGFISTDIVERVENLELDQSQLQNVSLRMYQEFGAKFAVVQQRTIIGDEMGCGKTLQALAFLSHLHNEDSRHLIVCPASVLINWENEIKKFTSFSVLRLHGPSKHAALARWESAGQIALTTFDTLRSLEFQSHRLPSTHNIVVDEAHFLKNPNTKRAEAVTSLTSNADHVLFLTGTPMENRVAEFHQLVRYLQPSLCADMNFSMGLMGSRELRKRVAPVYLRRNQEDILSELPERIEVEDWLEFTPKDEQAYLRAVETNNMMEMRRAAYASGSYSAKLRRVLEIVEEAGVSNQKVVVFSFFLSVLDAVVDAAPKNAFGPLTGSVAPTARQELINEFSATEGAAVLVSQIQAGGVGLNIQAASVVIVAEPQWKPSAEEQAIARCHRMGQTRTVQVHRLLALDSVDQRVRAILQEKMEDFDKYARPSEIKDQSVDAQATHTREALDKVINTDTEKHIIQLERERLGLDAPTSKAS